MSFAMVTRYLDIEIFRSRCREIGLNIVAGLEFLDWLLYCRDAATGTVTPGLHCVDRSPSKSFWFEWRSARIHFPPQLWDALNCLNTYA